jgi:hypothetical protein
VFISVAERRIVQLRPAALMSINRLIAPHIIVGFEIHSVLDWMNGTYSVLQRNPTVTTVLRAEVEHRKP